MTVRSQTGCLTDEIKFKKAFDYGGLASIGEDFSQPVDKHSHPR